MLIGDSAEPASAANMAVNVPDIKVDEQSDQKLLSRAMTSWGVSDERRRGCRKNGISASSIPVAPNSFLIAACVPATLPA